MANKDPLKFDKNVRSAFLAASGVIAHPDSPTGAGGNGAFTSPGPLGAKMSKIGDPAPPASPQSKVQTNQEVLDSVRNAGVTNTKHAESPKISDKEKLLLRLKEIRKLVKENNKSTMDDNMIICQIYMESSFDRYSGTPKAANKQTPHDAHGLMQMQLNGVKQVFKYRKQKENGGKMVSDKVTKAAFDEATAFYNSDKMLEEDSNITIGTEYLQYYIETTANLEAAYKGYRGKEKGVAYYNRIKAAAEKLSKEPESVDILLGLHDAPTPSKAKAKK